MTEGRDDNLVCVESLSYHKEYQKDTKRIGLESLLCIIQREGMGLRYIEKGYLFSFKYPMVLFVYILGR